jgi:hypothetical protein
MPRKVSTTAAYGRREEEAHLLHAVALGYHDDRKAARRSAKILGFGRQEHCTASERETSLRPLPSRL